MPRILIVLLVLMSIVLAGCIPEGTDVPGEDYTGGGWIDSAFSEEGGVPESKGKHDKAKKAEPTAAKATFGFALFGNEDLHDEVHGHFQYKDHGRNDEFPKGINIKGIVSECSCAIDLETSMAACTYKGTYRPKPRGVPEDEGTFEVTVKDLGEGKGDHGEISLKLTGGVFKEYENAGPLGGGNVQLAE